MSFPKLNDRQGWEQLLQANSWPNASPEIHVRYCLVMRRLNRKSEELHLFRSITAKIRRLARGRVSKRLHNEGRDIVESVTNDLLLAMLTPRSSDRRGLRKHFATTVKRRVADAVTIEIKRRRHFEPIIDEFAATLIDNESEARVTTGLLLGQVISQVNDTTAKAVTNALLDVRSKNEISADERYAKKRQETAAEPYIRYILDDSFDYDQYLMDKLASKWDNTFYMNSIRPDELALLDDENLFDCGVDNPSKEDLQAETKIVEIFYPDSAIREAING